MDAKYEGQKAGDEENRKELVQGPNQNPPRSLPPNSQPGPTPPAHRRRRMLKRESDKMHLLGRDDESEVIQKQELELELVELWKGEAAYLKTAI